MIYSEFRVIFIGKKTPSSTGLRIPTTGRRRIDFERFPRDLIQLSFDWSRVVFDRSRDSFDQSQVTFDRSQDPKIGCWSSSRSSTTGRRTSRRDFQDWSQTLQDWSQDNCKNPKIRKSLGLVVENLRLVVARLGLVEGSLGLVVEHSKQV